MTTRTLIILSIGWIAAMLILATAFVLSHRYTIIAIDNNYAWKIDQLTGQVYNCAESEYGPFCLPGPDHIKHSSSDN